MYRLAKRDYGIRLIPYAVSVVIFLLKAERIKFLDSFSKITV